MESSKMYSTSLLAASYKMRTRSPRTISTSSGSMTPNAPSRLASRFPAELTYDIPRVPVRSARVASRIPMRRATSIAAPRRSTAWPPSRGADARSTTTGVKPNRRSQMASACPATPAPEMSTSLLRTEPPTLSAYTKN